MAAPIIPFLKKLTTVGITDKKFLKRALGIMLGIFIIIMMPIFAVVGVFSQLANIDMSELQQTAAEYEKTANVKCAEIEAMMAELGYSKQQIEEAQALYAFALYDFGEEDGFVERLVECYTLAKQTDEELIKKINEAFGTSYTKEEYTRLMQQIRDNHVLDG